MPNVPFSTIEFPPDISTSAASATPSPDVPPPYFVPPVFDPTQGGYYGFGLSVAVQWFSGLAWSPVAGSRRGQCVFWRKSNEYTIKVITFVASRLANSPTVPHFNTGTDNDVLLTRTISAPVPEDMPDGQKAITIMGQYVYGMQMAPDLLDPILVPNSVLRAPAYIQLYPSQFTHLLCGPVLSPPAEFNGNVVNY